VAAAIYGGVWFVVFLSVGCAAAVREWHRLFSPRDYIVPTGITVLALVGSLLAQLYGRAWGLSPYGPFAVLLLGSACNFLLGGARREAPFAHAAGALYIALPALALLTIRQWAIHPVWLVVLTFIAVWATDTGALFSGSLIGGPKLAPRLSPKKTWAGGIGGLACAAILSGAVAIYLRSSVFPAAVFGMVLSLAGQGGDLFESMMKRRAGCKDSGGLIPGHGGVLDRIDSILFAAPTALAMLLAEFDPIAGAHA
jgi:phosphatidate cytidylyltransferase